MASRLGNGFLALNVGVVILAARLLSVEPVLQ